MIMKEFPSINTTVEFCGNVHVVLQYGTDELGSQQVATVSEILDV